MPKGRKPSDSLLKTSKGRSAAKLVTKVRVSALRAKHVDPKTLKDIVKKNADRRLGERQLLFAKYWAQGETPNTAARMAGYPATSVNTGWRLSNDPAIIKLYNAEKKLYEQAGQMTRQRVMDMLKESYDMAKIKAEPAVMVAAAREIGKMCGYYEPEVKININVGNKMIEQMQTLSDEELLKLIEQDGDIIDSTSTRIEDAPRLEAPQ